MTAQLSNVAIDISKHLLIKQAYEVCKAIEKCGASPELTNAVTKACALMQGIANAMDSAPVAYLYSASFERGHVEGELTDAHGCDMPVYSAPPAPVANSEYGDAYQGAREDLSIWKRRALEAEEEVRRLGEINDYLVRQAQGESRMGEPLIREPAPVAVPDEMPESAYEILSNAMGAKACFIADDLWNACRTAMLKAGPVTAATVPDDMRNALTLALNAMEFMGDTLNSLDAVCTEDVEQVTPAFEAVRKILAAAPAAPEQEV